MNFIKYYKIQEILLLTILLLINGCNSKSFRRGSSDKRNKCQCGQTGSEGRNDHKIINGEETIPGQYPWMAAMYSGKIFICGAVLINDRFLVTAGYCIAESEPPYRVKLMQHNRLDDSEDLVTRKVKNYTLHPNYGSPTIYSNDVAVLEVDPPINIYREDGPRPICLPDLDTYHTSGDAVIVGWGITEEYLDLADTLRHASLKIIRQKQCKKLNFMYKKTVKKDMVCAAGFFTGACSGDNGGPLQMRRKSDNFYELVGVASWGIGCAMEKFPGVYSRISASNKWIRNLAKSGIYCPV